MCDTRIPRVENDRVRPADHRSANLPAHSGLLDSPCVSTALAISDGKPRPLLVKLPFPEKIIRMSLNIAYNGETAFIFGDDAYEMCVCDQRSLLECMHFLGTERTISTYQGFIGKYLERAARFSGGIMVDLFPCGASDRTTAAAFIADAATALMCFRSTPPPILRQCHQIARLAFSTRDDGHHPEDAGKTGQNTLFFGDVAAAASSWNRLDAVTLATILSNNPVQSTYLTIVRPMVLLTGSGGQFELGGGWALTVEYGGTDVEVVLLRSAATNFPGLQSCECVLHVVDQAGVSVPMRVCCTLREGEEAYVVEWCDTKITKIIVSSASFAR